MGYPFRARFAFFLLFSIFVLVAVFGPGLPEADAQQVQQASPTLFQPSQAPPAAPAFNLPSEPAVPAGCTKPTKDQCTSNKAYWITDPCARPKTASRPAMEKYCTWVIQKEWTTTAGVPHQTWFPTKPPTSPFPALSLGRKVDRGKNVAPGSTNRPMGRRRFGSPTGAVAMSTAGIKQAMPALTVTRFNPAATLTSSNGTFGTTTFGSIKTVQKQIDQDLAVIRDTNWSTTNATTVTSSNRVALAAFTPPQFVTPGAGVASCEEYAYKRWGDYARFAFAAKRFGTNYREIYNLAMGATSPVNVNRVLKQTGTNEPIPMPITSGIPNEPRMAADGRTKLYDAKIVANPFTQVDASGWIPTTDPNYAKVTASKARPKAFMKTAPSEPLLVHKEARDAVERRYGYVYDDELADISKRTAAYADLVARRIGIQTELTCASSTDPCWRCSDPPNPGSVQLPATIQKLKDMVSGLPKINPADSIMLQSNPATRMGTFSLLADFSPFMGQLEREAASNSVPRVLKSGAGVVPVVPANACLADLAAKRTTLQAALTANTAQLKTLYTNEASLGMRGCLDIPSPNAPNMCDWSYPLFANAIRSALDNAIEVDYRACRNELANTQSVAPVKMVPAFNVVKTPSRQNTVFPCVHRRDFSGSALDVEKFLKWNTSLHGKACEAAREQKSTGDVQARYADQLIGLEWVPGEGTIRDVESDGQSLGDPASLGAYFNYDARWTLKGTKQAVANDAMSTCAFEGTASNTFNTGIKFFGEDLRLMELNGGGNAKTPVSSTFSGSYLDIESFSRKTVNQKASNGTWNAQLFMPPIQLGGIEVDFWVTIGPIPVHVVLGAIATAGIDYRFSGAPGNNCSNFQNAASNFKLVSTISPWVRGDAYADASVDAVVVSAGVRLDLNLLSVAMPLGVNISNVNGRNWELRNGGDIVIGMLSGSLTGYVEVGEAPLEVSYEGTIFDWAGFNTNVAVWGLDSVVEGGAIRAVMAPEKTTANVECICEGNTCCSLHSMPVACPSGEPKPDCAGAPETKVISGTRYLCRFNAYDATRLPSPWNSLCGGFVK